MSDWDKFWQDFFTYSGRLSRKRFIRNVNKIFIPFLTCFLGNFLLTNSELGERLPHVVSITETLMLIFLVMLIFCIITFVPRRFHDMGHSGWWTAPLLVIMFSSNVFRFILTLILFVWLEKDGEPGKNKYGNPPPDD